jgi:hypothetical protein
MRTLRKIRKMRTLRKIRKMRTLRLTKAKLSRFSNGIQGCQIFLDSTYQNGGKYTKLPQHYQMAVNIFQMT